MAFYMLSCHIVGGKIIEVFVLHHYSTGACSKFRDLCILREIAFASLTFVPRIVKTYLNDISLLLKIQHRFLFSILSTHV